MAGAEPVNVAFASVTHYHLELDEVASEDFIQEVLIYDGDEEWAKAESLRCDCLDESFINLVVPVAVIQRILRLVKYYGDAGPIFL